jgi:hypothetical protein
MTDYYGFKNAIFQEKRPMVSNSRILAQNYIDNGVHPDDFKKGKLKNELIFEYNRRKVLLISHIFKSFNKIQLLRTKHYLNLRTKNNKLEYFLQIIDKFTYKKLDNLHFFLLQVSKNEKKNVIPKSKSKKIIMKMGPKKYTRKRKKRKLK